MPIIKFIKENKEIEVPPGTNLRKAALQAGVYTNNGINGYFVTLNKFLNCHGLGLCGTCVVEILEGMENLSPKTKAEKKKLKGLPETFRLSCRCEVRGDVAVITKPKVP